MVSFCSLEKRVVAVAFFKEDKKRNLVMEGDGVIMFSSFVTLTLSIYQKFNGI